MKCFTPYSRTAATAFFVILLFTFYSFPLMGQSTGIADEGDTVESSSGDYEAYKPEEFPQWARSLRRYETIFFGSLPFAFLFTGLGFDLYKYADSNFSEAYLPLFLGTSPEKEAFNRDTVPHRITVSLSLSACIALVDFFLDKKGRDSGGRDDG